MSSRLAGPQAMSKRLFPPAFGDFEKSPWLKFFFVFITLKILGQHF